MTSRSIRAGFVHAGFMLAFALALAGCAGETMDLAAQSDEQGAGAPIGNAARSAEEAPGQVVASDESPAALLEAARILAASKGLGEMPGSDAAARAALAANAARRPDPAQNPQQGAAAFPAGAQTARAEKSDDDLADLNARIRLAALRLRAEREAARAASSETAAEDPRDMFRRAQARFRGNAAAGETGQSSPLVFGSLTSALSPPPAAAPPPSAQFIAALRQRETAHEIRAMAAQDALPEP